MAPLAFNATAQARDERHSNEVHVYGGELFGDDLTDTAISGRKPELDDDVTYGIRLAYNFTDTWGIELSVGETPTSVRRLAGGDIDLDLTTFDLDAVWHLNTGSALVPYLVAGAGSPWLVWITELTVRRTAVSSPSTTTAASRPTREPG